MFVDPEKRRKTKQLLAEGADVGIPKVDIDRLTPEEAQEFLDKIKPLQYVALARVIDPMIRAVVNEPLIVDKVPATFDDVYKAATDRFNDAISGLRDTDEYREADEYPKIISEINPYRHAELFTQLMGGAGTASHTMLGLLRDMPEIIEHHDGLGDLTVDGMTRIAKNSKRLAWNNATMSSQKLAALQYAVFLDLWTDEGYGVGRTEKLDSYHVVRDDDGKVHSISYSDLPEVVVPKDYRYREEGPLRQDTPLKDINDGSSVIIGCPITLVKGCMEDLWEWYAEAVRQNGCWVSGEKANTRS